MWERDPSAAVPLSLPRSPRQLNRPLGEGWSSLDRGAIPRQGERIPRSSEPGRNVRSHVIHGWWKDTGRVEDLLEANRIVLADLTNCIRGEVDDKSVIEGAVHLGRGTKVVRSRLRGPVEHELRR